MEGLKKQIQLMQFDNNNLQNDFDNLAALCLKLQIIVKSGEVANG